MKKEMIYDIMNGFIDLESISEPIDIIVQNEFCNGRECEKILGKVYRSKCSLGERLGDDEDDDVEQIINGMDEITRILSFKMYEYGRLSKEDVEE